MQIPNTLALFMFILLNATHTPRRQGSPHGLIDLKRGQYMSGRKVLAIKLNQTEQQIRTGLDRLEKLEILTIESTNKFSIYTIENYNVYQAHEESDNQEATNKQPANNQRITTKQELNHLSIEENTTPASSHKNKKRKETGVTLIQFLDQCKANKVRPIEDDDPIFSYAEKVGISVEMLSACWNEFKIAYMGKPKNYLDWRAAYRMSVRKNYYDLWYIKDGELAQWTSAGEQARRAAA